MIQLIHIISFIIKIIFQFFFFFNSKAKSQEAKIKVQRPVSIIICSKNNCLGLESLIPKVLSQNYCSFEVIIVDDFSSDGTKDLVNKFSDEKLRFLKPDGDFPGKKYALSFGINKAKYPWILLTDADCNPSSDLWIQKMMDNTNEEKKIVLGFGPYYKKNGLINSIARYETVMTAIQYFSMAKAGYAYMGVGRNLLYHKSLFEQVNGFQKHSHIISGDDDLFVQSVSNKTNTSIALLNETFMYSDSKSSYRKYLNQKRRHISTSNNYKPFYKLILTLYGLASLLYYLSISLLFFINPFMALISVGIFYVILYFTSWTWFKILKAKDLFIWIPILDFYTFVYYSILSPSLIFKKPVKWN